MTLARARAQARLRARARAHAPRCGLPRTRGDGERHGRMGDHGGSTQSCEASEAHGTSAGGAPRPAPLALPYARELELARKLLCNSFKEHG